MKYLYSLLLFAAVLISGTTLAQVPQGFNYQAIVRDISGSGMKNHSVMVLVSVTDGEGGHAEYQEVHKTVTDQFGMVNLAIGRGTPLKGAFNAIPWGNGNKYLEVAVDADGGENYEIVGTMELLSVPYAIYAANGGSASKDTSMSNELITGVNYNPATQKFSITEAGTTHSVALELEKDDLSDNSISDLSDVNVNPASGDILRWNGSQWVGSDGSDFHQQLAIINNLLTITDGNSIDLSTYLDNTDAQQLSFDLNTHVLTLTNGGQVDLTDLYNTSSPTYNTGLYYDSLTSELTVTDNGTVFTVDLSHLAHDADSDATNELQTVTKIGNVVSLSSGGGSFIDEVDDADADATNELQTVTQSGAIVTLSNGGGSFSIEDADADASNELQTIGKAGNVVTLSNGGGSFIDEINDADADATNELQTVSKTGNVVTLSNGGGSFIDEVNDADADATNELQTVTQSGTIVTLSNGGGSFNINDADADATNELQTIVKAGNVVTLSNGGGSFNVDDADADATNELQTISLSGDTLYLSNGGAVKLPAGGSASLSGTNNYLVKFTPNGATGGNSQIWDNGYHVGIGTNLPDGRLNVNAPAGQNVFKAEQNGATKMIINSVGNIGLVNQPNPNYPVDAQGYHTDILSRAHNTANMGTGVSGSGNNITAYVPSQGSGVAGTAYAIGVAGFATNSANSAFGGYFWNDNVYAYVGGWNLSGGTFTPYKIIGNGTVSTIVEGTQGEKLTMFAPEAPEVLFQDYGTAQLVNGRAVVQMDPKFSNNIEVSEDHPLKVFVQLEGECNGVYVTNKSATSFEVVELNGGTASIPFSYQIVATRKSTEIQLPDGSYKKASFDVRFPLAPDMIELKKLDNSNK